MTTWVTHKDGKELHRETAVDCHTPEQFIMRVYGSAAPEGLQCCTDIEFDAVPVAIKKPAKKKGD